MIVADRGRTLPRVNGWGETKSTQGKQLRKQKQGPRRDVTAGTGSKSGGCINGMSVLGYRRGVGCAILPTCMCLLYCTILVQHICFLDTSRWSSVSSKTGTLRPGRDWVILTNKMILPWLSISSRSRFVVRIDSVHDNTYHIELWGAEASPHLVESFRSATPSIKLDLPVYQSNTLSQPMGVQELGTEHICIVHILKNLFIRQIVHVSCPGW